MGVYSVVVMSHVLVTLRPTSGRGGGGAAGERDVGGALGDAELERLPGVGRAFFPHHDGTASLLVALVPLA